MEHVKSTASNADQASVQGGEHVEVADPSKTNESAAAVEPPKTWKDYAAANGVKGHEIGGYLAIKVRKLDETFQRGAQRFAGLPNSSLFSGVCIYVNGYTKPSADELRRVMQQYGGRYSVFYTKSKVTHVIATNLCKSKLLTLRQSDNVVHPDWIMDSLKAGRLLDLNDYRLPHYVGRTESNVDTSFSAIKGSLNSTTVLSTSAASPAASHVSATLEVSGSRVELNSTSIEANRSIDASCNASRLESAIPASIEESSCSKVITVSENVRQDAESSATANPNRQPLDCRQPGFVASFYARSRLHFLSTWHFELVDYVLAARNRRDSHVFSGKQRLLELAISRYQNAANSDRCTVEKHPEPDRTEEPVIFHVDLDCFFASVSLLNRPELENEPVCVTHSKTGAGKSASVPEDNRSDAMSYAEIASCNYAARRFGVRNGMFVGEALKRCPNLHFIEYDFDSYRSVSRTYYDLILSYTLELEAVSCDEMYADLTGLLGDLDRAVFTSLGTSRPSSERIVDPLFVADTIRAHVFEICRVRCSIGVGSNKLLARLATRRAKPDGSFRVRAHAARTFMREVPVADLPGVGYSIAHRLRSQFGVTTCADFLDGRRVSIAQLQAAFGAKLGRQLAEKCAGVCTSGEFASLRYAHERKSISCDVNYGIRFTTSADASRFIAELAEEVASRLRSCARRARKLTLRLLVRSANAPKETRKFLGHGVCDAVSRSVLLPASSTASTTQSAVIARECLAMFNALHVDVTDVRGVAIQASKLEDERASSSISGANQRTILEFMNESNSVGVEQRPVNSTSLKADTRMKETSPPAVSKSKAAATVNLTELPSSNELQVDNTDNSKAAAKSCNAKLSVNETVPAPQGAIKSKSVGISVEDAALDFSFELPNRALKRVATATLERFCVGRSERVDDSDVAIVDAVVTPQSELLERPIPARRRRHPDCIVVISSDSESDSSLAPGGMASNAASSKKEEKRNSVAGSVALPKVRMLLSKPIAVRRKRGRPAGSVSRMKDKDSRLPKSILKRKSSESLQLAYIFDNPLATGATKRQRGVRFGDTLPSERPESRALTASSVDQDDQSASASVSVSTSVTIPYLRPAAAAVVTNAFRFERLLTATDELDIARVFRSWVFNDPDAPIDLDAATAAERCALPKDKDVERLIHFLSSLIATRQLDTLVRCVRVLRHVIASLQATTTQSNNRQFWFEAQQLVETVVQDEFGRRYRHASLRFD